MNAQHEDNDSSLTAWTADDTENQSREHVKLRAQEALESLVENYLTTERVDELVDAALRNGEYVGGAGALERLDDWEDCGAGLLRRHFYVATPDGPDAALLRIVYYGEFEGHSGFQLLVCDDEDREIAMIQASRSECDMDGP